MGKKQGGKLFLLLGDLISCLIMCIIFHMLTETFHILHVIDSQ